MAVKIRLQRRGRKKLPLYHIVIADSRSPRDGRFIENIGSYNPLTKPALIELDRDKAFDWLMKGAEPTDTVRAILKFKGVMYRKHLSRGVAKGAMTQEEADAKYTAWVDEKEAHIAKRKQATSDEMATYHAKRSGTAKPVKAKVEEVAAEETVTETPVEEVATAEPAAEPVVEETAAETPVAEEKAVEETAVTETPEEAPVTETEGETSEASATEKE